MSKTVKGYTVEVIDSAARKSEYKHFKENEKEAAIAYAKEQRFAIVTEWAQSASGLGNYEVEILRHDCR